MNWFPGDAPVGQGTLMPLLQRRAGFRCPDRGDRRGLAPSDPDPIRAAEVGDRLPKRPTGRGRARGRDSATRAANRPVLDGRGPAEQIPLTEADAEALDRLGLGRCLDALREHERARDCGEVDEPCDEGLAGDIDVDATDDADVDLHEVRSKVDQVPEVGDARAGIIGRDPDVGAERLRAAWSDS